MWGRFLGILHYQQPPQQQRMRSAIIMSQTQLSLKIPQRQLFIKNLLENNSLWDGFAVLTIILCGNCKTVKEFVEIYYSVFPSTSLSEFKNACAPRSESVGITAQSPHSLQVTRIPSSVNSTS